MVARCLCALILVTAILSASSQSTSTVSATTSTAGTASTTTTLATTLATTTTQTTTSTATTSSATKTAAAAKTTTTIATTTTPVPATTSTTTTPTSTPPATTTSTTITTTIAAVTVKRSTPLAAKTTSVSTPAPKASTAGSKSVTTRIPSVTNTTTYDDGCTHLFTHDLLDCAMFKNHLCCPDIDGADKKVEPIAIAVILGGTIALIIMCLVIACFCCCRNDAKHPAASGKRYQLHPKSNVTTYGIPDTWGTNDSVMHGASPLSERYSPTRRGPTMGI